MLPGEAVTGAGFVYERPAVPYRIDVWEVDATCQRSMKIISVTGDGSDAGQVDSVIVPATSGALWTGPWSVEVTSTTGAELTLRFQVSPIPATPL